MGILSTLRRQRKNCFIDAGLSGKKITGLLAEIDRKPEDLDAILITHEHSDHIHGVGVLARKYGMDLYANEATWKAMEGTKYLGKVDDAQKHIFEMGEDQDILAISISKVWGQSRCCSPSILSLYEGWQELRHADGYGLCGDRLAGIVADADGYLIESNHDVEILRAGSYAWRLKQRILSDLGHLSNEDGADAMIRTLGIAPRRFIWGICQKRTISKNWPI